MSTRRDTTMTAHDRHAPLSISQVASATLLGLVTLLALPGLASAQYSDEYRTRGTSPERFDWQLHIGPYTPYVGSNAFRDIFGGDGGPMLAMELDTHIVRIPYVGPLGIGVRGGWSRYRARACSVSTDGSPDCDNRADEKEKFVLLPVSIMATLRVDVLARELNFPLVITGKLGLDTFFWRSRRGGSSQGSGRSLGMRWGVMFALELDFIEPRAARRLDEDWGINHSYLFVELYGSLFGTSIPMRDAFTWSAGLGLSF